MARVIDEGDCSVRYIALPATVRALTTRDPDGHYNVYINERLSAAQQQDALLHELQHLLRDDFDPARSFEQAEAYRPAETTPAAKTVAVPRIETLGGLLRFVTSLHKADAPTGTSKRPARLRPDITADEKRKPSRG